MCEVPAKETWRTEALKHDTARKTGSAIFTRIASTPWIEADRSLNIVFCFKYL